MIKAHQRLIRENRELIGSGTLFEFLDEKPLMSLKNAKIKEVDYFNAKQLIDKYEWLESMPSNSYKIYGLFIESILVGIVCYSQAKAGGTFSLFGKHALCLSRGACVHFAPKNSSSYLIQNSLKMLPVYNPIYIVAYSDFESGEIGQVYQSCNWFYLGEFQSKQWINPKGEKFDMAHHRNISRKIDENFIRTKKLDKDIVLQTKESLINKGWKLKNGTIRGKYIIVVGKNCKEKRDMIKFIKSISKKYPKRQGVEEQKTICEGSING